MVIQLWNKRIPLVKVLWAKHASSEATWEIEEEMRSKYPYLSAVNPRFLSKLPVSGTKITLREKVVTAQT